MKTKNFIEGPFQLPDICVDMKRDIFNDIIGEVEIFFFCFFLENGTADFKIRFCDRNNQAGTKTGPQTVFEFFYIIRRPVTGHNNMFLIIKKIIKSMKYFQLGRIFASDSEELHIIDEKIIYSAVPFS